MAAAVISTVVGERTGAGLVISKLILVGFTVIWIDADVSLSAPETTTRRYQVVAVRAGGA